MDTEIRKLIADVISASIKHYDEFRPTYKKNEWTNDQIANALMNTMVVEFKKLNLLRVSQRSEQLPKRPVRMDGHADDCQCKPCRLLESIFGNCG